MSSRNRFQLLRVSSAIIFVKYLVIGYNQWLMPSDPEDAMVRDGRRVASTIREVAESAGVSIASVSRVFSGFRVTEDISRRVREAARTLNYQPNRVARNLRSRQTQTIGVIIPDIENPFYTSVIGGIEEVLQAAEYSLLLANSNENPKREQTNVRTFQSEGVAGIIFTPSGSDSAMYAQLMDTGIPLVAISRVPDSLQIDAVSTANREGARTAMAHLMGLGHRRIAMISGPPWISTAQERLRGFEEGDAYRVQVCRYAATSYNMRISGSEAGMMLCALCSRYRRSPPPCSWGAT